MEGHWLPSSLESNSGDQDFTCTNVRKPNINGIGLPVLEKTYLPQTLYWPMVESSLGIVGACLPLFHPIIGEFTPVRNIRKIISFPSMSITSSKKPLTDAEKLENGDTSSSAISSEGSAGGDHNR